MLELSVTRGGKGDIFVEESDDGGSVATPLDDASDASDDAAELDGLEEGIKVSDMEGDMEGDRDDDDDDDSDDEDAGEEDDEQSRQVSNTEYDAWQAREEVMLDLDRGSAEVRMP